MNHYITRRPTKCQTLQIFRHLILFQCFIALLDNLVTGLVTTLLEACYMVAAT